MTIYIGIAGIPISTKGGTIEGIKDIAKLGLDAMEVQFVRGVKMSDQLATKAKEVAEENNVLLSVHAPYFINLASDKEDTREKSKLRIIESSKKAKLLDAYIVTVHAGYYSKLGKEHTLKLMREAMEDILPKSPVKIGFETMGKQKSFGTLEEIIELGDLVVPVIDFSHIHARCNGCLKTVEDIKKIISKVLNVWDLKLIHCHYTDIEYKNGNEKRHLIMGEGNFDFKIIAKAMLDFDVDFCVICESPVLEKDAIKMKEIINNLL